MSYLHLPSLNLADFSKGTISIWFRFSKDSVDNARAHNASYQPPDFGDGATGPSIFASTIPIVTFGRKVMAHTYGAVPHAWAFPTGGIGATTFDSVQRADAPAEPSHLGLVIDPANRAAGTYLRMYFQTSTHAEVQGLVTEATDIHWELDASGNRYEQYQVVKDISYIRVSTPEWFEIIPGFEVDPDKWHHLLVSFDFSTSVDVVALANYTGDDAQRDAIKSNCKLWYAFDDENKTGQDDMGDSWAHHGPNDVVPVSALQAAFNYFPQSPPISSTGKPMVTGEFYDPEYHWTASPLPMNGGPVGLPASADYVDTIYHCEMAEFQFFGNRSMDTSRVTNRRAFIDFVKDEDGTPIVDPDGKATLEPVDPSKAEELVPDPTKPNEKLGRPHILLHGTSDWQDGKNTGSVGIIIDEHGEAIIAAGQFSPKGGIEAYEPDPSLKK